MTRPTLSSSAYVIPAIRPWPKKQITAGQIITIICEYFRIERETVFGKKRAREIVVARHFCILFVLKYTSLTLKSTGTIFNRDHTTILYGRQSIMNQINAKVDNWYKTDFHRLTSLIDDL